MAPTDRPGPFDITAFPDAPNLSTYRTHHVHPRQPPDDENRIGDATAKDGSDNEHQRDDWNCEKIVGYMNERDIQPSAEVTADDSKCGTHQHRDRSSGEPNQQRNPGSPHDPAEFVLAGIVES